MPQFRIIDNINNIQLSSEWKKVDQFNSRNHILYQKNGRSFQILEKYEKEIPRVERAVRYVLGSVILLSTLGLAWLIKPVKHLFSCKKSLRFAIPVLISAAQTRYQFDDNYIFKTPYTPTKVDVQKQISFPNRKIDIEKEDHQYFFDQNNPGEKKMYDTLVQYKDKTTISDDNWKSLAGISKKKLNFLSFPNPYDSIMAPWMAKNINDVIQKKKLSRISVIETRLFKVPSFILGDDLNKKYRVFSKNIPYLDIGNTRLLFSEEKPETQEEIIDQLCTLVLETGFINCDFECIRWSSSLKKMVIIDPSSHGLLISNKKDQVFDWRQKPCNITSKEAVLEGLNNLKKEMRGLNISSCEKIVENAIEEASDHYSDS